MRRAVAREKRYCTRDTLLCATHNITRETCYYTQDIVSSVRHAAVMHGWLSRKQRFESSKSFCSYFLNNFSKSTSLLADLAHTRRHTLLYVRHTITKRDTRRTCVLLGCVNKSRSFWKQWHIDEIAMLVGFIFQDGVLFVFVFLNVCLLVFLT